MTTEKKEPIIIPNGNSVEEVYQWMEEKLEARKAVASLETQLNSLNSAQNKAFLQLEKEQREAISLLSQEKKQEHTDESPAHEDVIRCRRCQVRS
ncbi:hypothetical protein [Morganella morganii]|uniref:hypothetical protein n=1 Tax=Morganella morganii TaxID=582 RepID=UPI0013B3BFF1|nr:hypothetical protein [Morganella morganii]